MRLMRRYWLSLLVGALGLIWALGPLTAGAQTSPTATPDINTVPPLKLLWTPTPTTPPLQVPIVTATAIPSAPTPTPAGGTTTDGNGSAEEGAGDGAGADGAIGNPPGNSGGAPAGGTEATGGFDRPPTVNSDSRPGSGPQLRLSILPDRAFAWQGQPVQLALTMRNEGDQPAMAVTLQSDLPAMLAVQAIDRGSSAAVQQVPTANQQQLTITWPRLEPGATETVLVTLVIRPSTPNGSFIDIFAMVHAQEVPAVVAGISIAMPPAHPPQFN